MKKHFLLALAIGVALGANALPKGATEPALLLRTSQGLMAPVWSPTGDKIAVTGDNYCGIFVANADGSGLSIVTEETGAGYKMSWSNDGAQILGRTSSLESGKIFYQVKTWTVADKTSRVVVDKTRALTGTPTWKSLAALDSNGKMKASAIAGNVYETLMSDPAGAAQRIGALGEFSGKIVINPALSPDGTKVAFQVPGKGIYVCGNDGSNLHFVAKASHPAWLADGETIVATVVADNGETFTGSKLYAIDTRNGESVLLVDREGMIPLTPAVTADGARVAFENAADASIYVINLKF